MSFRTHSHHNNPHDMVRRICGEDGRGRSHSFIGTPNDRSRHRGKSHSDP
jgi:hypothetical protein